jgi:hypothetical protein
MKPAAKSVLKHTGAERKSHADNMPLPVTLTFCAHNSVWLNTRHKRNCRVRTLVWFNNRNTVMKQWISPFLVLVSLMCCSVTLSAQELNPTVNVILDQLSMDDRQEVLSMANVVRDYLSNVRYTGRDWEGEKIPVDLTIYITGRSGNKYTARLAVVSKRLVNNEVGSGAALLRTYDKSWDFMWSFNPTLTFQPMRYDPFTSVIDFYMMVAIGLDLDTYEDLGGDMVYSSAKQIAQLGNAAGVTQFSTNFQPGEYTRMALITELTDLRYTGLRRLFYDYHDAIDKYGKNPTEGRTAILRTVNDIAEFKRSSISNRSVLLQAFFDAKGMELADIFKGMRDSPIWTLLGFLDAGNSQMYQEARGG